MGSDDAEQKRDLPGWPRKARSEHARSDPLEGTLILGRYGVPGEGKTPFLTGPSFAYGKSTARRGLVRKRRSFRRQAGISYGWRIHTELRTPDEPRRRESVCSSSPEADSLRLARA